MKQKSSGKLTKSVNSNTNSVLNKSKSVAIASYIPGWQTSASTLKHYSEVAVIDALLLNDTNVSARSKLGLPASSNLSDYLKWRGLTLRQFCLIQFVKGASPDKVRKILKDRKGHSASQFWTKRYSFFSEEIQRLYNEYIELFHGISSRSKRDQDFFEKVRFMSALYSTDSIKQAAEILSEKIETVQQFINDEHVQLELVKKLENEHISNAQNPGAVVHSSSEVLGPAACPRDPEILLNEQIYCAESNRSGSRGQAAGRRDLNCQQNLMTETSSSLQTTIEVESAEAADIVPDSVKVDFFQSSMSFFGGEYEFSLFPVEDFEEEYQIPSSLAQ